MTGTESKLNKHIEAAARKLVEGFSKVDGEMLATKVEEDNGNPLPLPMWSTLFQVDDPCDARRIGELLRPGLPEAEMDALRCIRDHGLGLADGLAEYYTCSECGEGISYTLDELISGVPDGAEVVLSPCCGAMVDVDDSRLVEDTIEAWRNSSDENERLASAGWQEVGDTGILAFEHDGELYLGVNGAGYNFYDSHWIELYKLLGYEWHISTFREERLMEAVDELTKVAAWPEPGDAKYPEADELREMWRFVQNVAARRTAISNGGPLTDEELKEGPA